jgi:signal transduction histidine kinase
MTFLAIAGRLALDPVLGIDRNRHLIFLPTAMLAAFYGGFGPGLSAVVLCTAAIDYFWTQPRFSFNHGANVELALFLMAGIAICGVIESLHKARARADQAKLSREHVLAIVAHDLRNPLNAIKMTSAQLRRTVFDADSLRRRLSTIDRSAVRMEGLIRDIIDATRIEFGELTVILKGERVAPIVQQTLEDFTPLAEERDIELKASAVASELTILCDRERMLQVLANLLGNAFQFTPDRGRIELCAKDLGASVRFDVKDTGPGIKPEYLPHIFERYWTASGQGTGLGLFIAQSLIEAHHGRLWVESAEGQGARFSLSIPRPAETQPQASDVVRDRGRPRLGLRPRLARPRRQGDAG